MQTREQRAEHLSTAVWLIGLGVMLGTRSFFPNILFVAVAAAVVKGVAEGKSLRDYEWVVWTLAVGVWFVMGLKLSALIVSAGIAWLVLTLLSPVVDSYTQAKPYVDKSLE